MESNERPKRAYTRRSLEALLAFRIEKLIRLKRGLTTKSALIDKLEVQIEQLKKQINEQAPAVQS